MTGYTHENGLNPISTCFYRIKLKWYSLSIHRMSIMDTQLAILEQLPLPNELVMYVKEFAAHTRLDWRTCRRHEAELIEQLHEHFLYQILDPNYDTDWMLDTDTVIELSTWSLFGLTFILNWLDSGGVHRYGRPPRCLPSDDYNYRKWYTQTFMYICFY